MVVSDTKTGRERASGTAERHRRAGTQPAVQHARRTAPSRAAFWLVAGVLCPHSVGLLFAAALAYCVAVAALVAVAAGSLTLGRRGPATGQDISQAGPGPLRPSARARRPGRWRGSTRR